MKITQTLMRWSQILVLALSMHAVAAEEASNSITAIEVMPEVSGKQLVTISMSQAATVPASFAVNTPPRIAFDFVNTSNAAGKNMVPVTTSTTLKQINVAEGAGRTRLVFNLLKSATYETKVDGKKLFITLDGMASASPVVNATTQFSEVKIPVGKKEGIKDVDFRRGKNGEGKIIVDLSSPNVGIDIRQQGKNLVLDFAKTQLPKNLERRMDVSDFGTPVQKVDTYTQGDSVKMAIEPKGNWEYSAYQTENRFIVEIKTVSDEQLKQAQQAKPAYKGDKLSLNFQNVEIRVVLQVIAEFTGKNIIASDTVNGSLTLRLKDVPWDQALDLILQTRGLDKRENGNVMWIAPRQEIAQQEKSKLETTKQIQDIEPLRTESFQLKYQKADDFKKLLDQGQNILSPRGSAVVDSRTNTLFVHDIPSKLEEIRGLLSKTDVPVRQVMIEARIVEASDTFSRSLGVRIGLGSKGNIGSTTVATGNNMEYVNSIKGTEAIGSTSNFVNLPSGALNSATGGASYAVLFSSSAGNLLGLELSALESDGKGKIVSSPRLITADQVEAVIEDGKEIPYLEASSSGATSVRFKKATLSLKVKPQITPDGNIIMDLKVNKDSPDVASASGTIMINTKQINTQVLVENGGTVVIGGVYSQVLQDTVDKVPFLGDIPILGNLFKRTVKTDNKTELLIFITPRILKQELTLR